VNYLHDIYRLAYIKRYSNVPKLHEESVAEHGFFVAAILISLREKYVFNLGRALLLAVSHDMPEMELNDCPHIIKRKYPSIAAAYEECEKEVADQLPPLAKYAILEFDKGESIEAKMVNLADAIQCIQFSHVEVQLGNIGYMKVVFDGSTNRVKQLEKELEQYEISQSK